MWSVAPTKKGPANADPFKFPLLLLSSVEFDDLLLLEEGGEVLSFRKGDDLASELRHIWLHISRDSRTLEVIVSSDAAACRSVSDFDRIANLQLEARDVDESAVHHDVAVADHLSRLENCLCKAQSPHSCREPELEKPEEVQAGVAGHALSFLERVQELLFEHVVVASDDLLCEKLFAVLGLASIL
jgi:hypothetical protein